MRILWLCPFVPFPPDTGSSTRVFALLRELAGLHEVTLVCLDDPLQESCDLRPLQDICQRVHLLSSPPRMPLKLHHAVDFFSIQPGSLALNSRRLLAELTELSRAHTFDLMQVEFLPLAAMALQLEVPVRVITEHYLAVEAYEHYTRTLRGIRRWYFQRELRKLRRWEPDIIRRYSHVLVTSGPHLKIVSGWVGRERVTQVPNGVDVDYFAPVNTESRHNEFVFMGSFHLNPANLQTLAILLEKVLPVLRKRIPDLVLHVIGKGIPKEVGAQAVPNVRFHGYLLDIRPLLASSTAMLLPMVGGSGTKIRVLTAMAMGKVVITTPDGLAGLECEEGREVLIVRSWEEMAAMAARVSADVEFRRRIGRAARAAVVQRFSWAKLATIQARLWERLIET